MPSPSKPSPTVAPPSPPPVAEDPSSSPTTMTRRRPSAAELAKLDDIAGDLRHTSDLAKGMMDADLKPENSVQIKALLDHAKDIVFQLRSVMGTGYEVDFTEPDGQLPSYDNLVNKLTCAFRHQRDVNQLNAKLMSVNYVVNLSNFAHTRQLTRAVMRGRAQIRELQSSVTCLEHTVDELNVEVDVQKLTAERLKQALDSTRRLLENTVVEYRQEMGRQRDMIRQQSTMIGQLYQNKFNQDFVLDASIVLFCLWATNTTLVDMPLRTAVQTTLSQLQFLFPSRPGRASPMTAAWVLRRRTAWAQQVVKLVLVVMLVRRLRRGAAAYGLHNRIGATYPYVTAFFGMIYDSVAKRASPGSSSLTLPDTTGKRESGDV